MFNLLFPQLRKNKKNTLIIFTIATAHIRGGVIYTMFNITANRLIKRVLAATMFFALCIYNKINI